MVSDFMKLLDFKSSVDKASKILSSFGNGPQVRKATVFSGSHQALPGTISVVQSSPSELTMSARHISTTTSVKVWGYVTWTPSIPDFGKSVLGDPESARLLAKRIALGLTLDASVAWELLPWSWLIDWFSNVGDYISSSRSLIPVRPNLPAICTTTRTVQLFCNTNNAANIQHGKFQFTRTRITKQRVRASSVYPSADLPLLSGRQVGILLSLAALRSR
jgi:hypothetical protein